MSKLLDSIEKKELSNKINNDHSKRSIVLDIVSNSDGSKDKQISAKVNEQVYKLFTQINRAQGISNNSALNMIISRYVRENKGILEDTSTLY